MCKTNPSRVLLILISLLFIVCSFDMKANIKNPKATDPCLPPCCEKMKIGNQVKVVYHCKCGYGGWKRECDAICHVDPETYDVIYHCPTTESHLVPCCIANLSFHSETYECNNPFDCSGKEDLPDCETICWELEHNMPGCLWTHRGWTEPIPPLY